MVSQRNCCCPSVMVICLRISILGTRGIPASYGGFETCVEEISTRLAARGHDVRVYCRSAYPNGQSRSYKGVRLVQMPMLKKSFVASPFNSLIANVHASLSDAEVIHFFGCGNIPFTLPARLSGKKVVLTLDGLEWKRMSYSQVARMYLRSFEELAMVFPHATVADSVSSQDWYFQRTGIMPRYIPYGITRSTEVNDDILKKYDLERENYVLFSGRLVYEKGAHTLIEAFRSVKGDVKLAIVGDYPGGSEYTKMLKQNADSRTVFLGFVYGKEFETARNGALIYVHPSLLDGTSISLLGALGSGRCVLSSDLKENRDVAGESAEYFAIGDPEDLKSKLQHLLDNRATIAEAGGRAMARAKALFDWDMVTDAYEETYTSLADR